LTPPRPCGGCRFRQTITYPGLTIRVCDLTGAVVGLECALGLIEEPGCSRREERVRSFAGAVA